MIDRVEIRNFQALESVDVVLGTLTVFVGPNDLGKSALFRAIRAAAEARSGNDFVTFGKQAASVTLHVDGHSLRWEKGERVNRYYFDGTLFDRVGSSIPPDLEEFLALGAVEYDRDLKLNLNFADQDDPAFLIPISGGISATHVAKVLGDLTKLNVLFRAVREADTMRSRSAGQARLHDDDIAGLELRLEAFSDLPARRTSVEAAGQALAKVQVLQGQISELTYLRQRLAKLSERYEATRASLLSIPPSTPIDRILELEHQVLELERARFSVDSLRRRYKSALDQYSSTDESLSFAQVELDAVLDGVSSCPLCGQPMNPVTDGVQDL
jgi:DNA repair exonuclease SbcCD ATPase subunit